MSYRTLVVDPPWRYATTMAVTGNAPGRTRQHGRSGAAMEYPTMSVAEIEAVPVPAWADRAGAHLYLWTTNTHIEAAFGVARAWGFTVKNVLTWCKRPKGMIGFGAFSGSTEFVIFASSARRAIHTGRSATTWFEWPRTIRHSAKPEAFYDLVESVSPGPYLDVFARRARDGWGTWGDEAPRGTSQPEPTE